MSVSEEDKKILETIGIQLGKRRTALGKTQEEIAKALKIDRGNYNKIESGKCERKLSYSQLVKVSKELNTSFDYIFGETDEATPNIDDKNICNRYGITEDTLRIIDSARLFNCSDALNDFIYDFGLLHLSSEYKILKLIDNMIVDNFVFLEELEFFSDYIIKNYKNKNEINEFFQIFENKINNIKLYNKFLKSKDDIYNSWKSRIPTLLDDEATIINLFEEIKNSLNKNKEKFIKERINSFVSYIASLTEKFERERELRKFKFIKDISRDLDSHISDKTSPLYYKELEKYDKNNSFFTKEEIREFKNQYGKNIKVIQGIPKL